MGQHLYQGLPRPLKGIRDLAALPWFEVIDGELCMPVPVGPSIDVHTHLAQSFFFHNVDIAVETTTMRHYLPVDADIDLDVYVNVNIPPAAKREMGRDLGLGWLTGGTMRPTHTGPNLAREMARTGVRRSVILPIDLPFGSSNGPRYLELGKGRDDLIAFGCVHPKASRLREKVEAQIAMGARGFKLQPGFQFVNPSCGGAMELYGILGEHGLPILVHCGPVGIEPYLVRRNNLMSHFVAPIEENPDTVFLLGHSGSLQLDEALAMHRKHDNAWLELSCQSLTNLRRILREADPERIVNGSDWPWYHLAISQAKILIATEGNEVLRAKAMWQNAERLLGIDPA